MIDAFGAHIAGKNTTISSKSSNGDADVVIDLEDLALMGGELGLGLVYAGQDDVGFGSEANCSRALIHCFHGILHLEQPPRRAPRRHVCVVLVPEHLH